MKPMSVGKMSKAMTKQEYRELAEEFAEATDRLIDKVVSLQNENRRLRREIWKLKQENRRKRK